MIGLSKLRQYMSGDPIKYLQTEMRQNLLSIEKTCESLVNYLVPVYVGLISNTTLSATATALVFDDVLGEQRSGSFNLDAGDYILEFSINNYAVTNGIIKIVLTNEVESQTYNVAGITSGVLSGSTFFKVNLYIDKKTTVNALTTGSASSIGSGSLIINKINI